jgi:multiple antibiotic resistance protein
LSVFTIALTLFLIANPVGNSPAIIALIKDFDFKRQRFIAFREAMLALLLALFFQYFGEIFLNALQIKPFAVTITGGLLLFAVALSMIFSFHESTEEAKQVKQEPFFVPIATPIISGPGLLATIMMFSQRENNNFKITMAILITWVGVTVVMTFSPYLQKLLGKRGLAGMEQLMGMILALISMELIVKGSSMLYHAIYT